MAHFFYPRLRLLLIFFSIFVSSFVSAESLREYHQRKCTAGNTESCKQAEAMLEGEQYAERIVEYGDRFATTVDRSILEEENKPLLNEAYSLILDDYFKNESENGIKRAVTIETLNLCAEHFHNYWVNRKLWWPTDDVGKPDWSTIYYYIVEHYFGYCLRSVQ